MKSSYIRYFSWFIGALLLAACGPDPLPVISYPPTGAYGDNILLPTKTSYTTRANSFTAVLPKDKKVRILITGKTSSNTGGLNGVWYYSVGTQNNWSQGSFDVATYTQTFTSVNGGLTSDLKIEFDKGTFQIDYFENDVATPSATKTITVNY